MDIIIEQADPGDAKRLAEVFNLSFHEDYLKYGECPGYGKSEQDMLHGMKEYIVYKISKDGLIVGAISVHEQSPTEFFLGALCVIPDYANKRIGQRAMKFLDEEFLGTISWTLETPADKEQNHYFYKKFGYRVTREYYDGGVLVSCFERKLRKI